MYEVKKYQRAVLEALGLQAGTDMAAEEIFKELGIVVHFRREGRATTPTVRMADLHRHAWNIGGDADVWTEQRGTLTAEQRAKIAQWIVE